VKYGVSGRFIAPVLARQIRIEEDLIDQLFNSSEKRLARALLLLARYGKQDKPIHGVPKVSPATLAEMVGTSRSRVNFFLNKFKKLGFIEYDGERPVKVTSFAAQRRPARLIRRPILPNGCALEHNCMTRPRAMLPAWNEHPLSASWASRYASSPPPAEAVPRRRRHQPPLSSYRHRRHRSRSRR